MIRRDRAALDSSRVQAFIDVYRGVKLEYPLERMVVGSMMRKFLDIVEVALEQELDVSCLKYDGRVDEKGEAGEIWMCVTCYEVCWTADYSASWTSWKGQAV